MDSHRTVITLYQKKLSVTELKSWVHEIKMRKIIIFWSLFGIQTQKLMSQKY